MIAGESRAIITKYLNMPDKIVNIIQKINYLQDYAFNFLIVFKIFF